MSFQNHGKSLRKNIIQRRDKLKQPNYGGDIRTNKNYYMIKTGRYIDKTPCSLLCKMENFIVHIARIFWREISGE